MEWYIVNVEAAVLHDGRYLIIQRSLQESHAAGMLAFPGGKVEDQGEMEAVLEETLRREVREETGVEVRGPMKYVKSNLFEADDGDPVVNLLFLCRYAGGEPLPTDPAEVEDLFWMSAAQLLADERAPEWTRGGIRAVDELRSLLGW